MKRTVLALVLLAGLIAVPAMAQDFTSTRPQFFSFSYGVPVGQSLEISEIVVGQAHNWSVAIAIMSNVDVGFDHVTLRGTNWEFKSDLLRVQYHFLEQVHVAFGFGMTPTEGSALSIGAGANFFQTRSASGYTFAIGLRLDYVTHLNTAEDVSLGVVFGALRITLGI